MSCVAEFTIPPDSFPFGATLAENPEIEIEVDQIVPTRESALPFFWVRGSDPEAFMEYAEREPQVRNARVLERVEDVALFRAEWYPDATLIRRLEEIDVTIVESVGTADHWRFEVRTADRSTFTKFREIFEDQGIPIHLNRLYDLDELLREERGPLTPKQRDTLATAYRMGYFDAPRGVTQEQLAEEFGISRRAVAERLRRGTQNLVAAALVADGESDEDEGGSGEGEPTR